MRGLRVFAFLAFALTVGAQDDNILKNGGFEEEDAEDLSRPSGWICQMVDGSDQGVHWVYKPFEGNPDAWIGLNIEADTGHKQWRSAPVNVAPGQQYLIDFDYKTNARYTFVRVEFWSNQSLTEWKGMVEISDEKIDGLPSLALTDDWRNKSGKIVVPEGASFATVSFNALAGWGWCAFDNARMAEQFSSN